MRFIEFLTEGIARKTYRKRRVLPNDARWAAKEFEKVDQKGTAMWITAAVSPSTKTITKRQEVALIDHAQNNKEKYGWTWETSRQSENRLARDRPDYEKQAYEEYLTAWKEPDDMQVVHL